jgi:hypothetical protein
MREMTRRMGVGRVDLMEGNCVVVISVVVINM